MFEWLGRLAVRYRRGILAATVLAVIGAGAMGHGVADRLSSGGFADPRAESQRAADLLDARFGTAEPNFVLVVTGPPGKTVDDPTIRETGSAVTDRLRRERGVVRATSYWSMGSPDALRSDDHRSALIMASLAGDEEAVNATIKALRDRYRDQDGLRIRAAGSAEVYREMTEILKHDLVRAESYAMPLTLLLLLVVFGGLVAAGLPLLIGVVAVSGTFLVLWVLSSFTDVSMFALNVTTALGLGLAIDYSLFVVSRFREELERGIHPHDAVRETVRTAGRTVVYSAATVALSLLALLVFPLYFLRSFAYAGIAVVVLAALAAIVILPALLAVVGHRVNRLAVRRGGSPPRHSRPAPPFWERLAGAVMRRPLQMATVIVLFLLTLGIPFLNARFGLPDDRALPTSAQSRQAGDIMRGDFGSREAEPIFAVSAQRADPAEIHAYASELSRIDGTARVDASTGSYHTGVRISSPTAASARLGDDRGSWLSIVPAVETYSPEGQRLVRNIRATPAPVTVLVGGRSAVLLDTSTAIKTRLPLALTIIAVAVGVLLFLFTGSIIVPLKALVLNLLSLSATFGAMVWVFQEGHLRWLVGDFAVTGTLDTTIPILMFCVAFGLSMDYEVFLLSRIREEWELTGDNASAVRRGLGHTGKLITATAALVSIVFLSFATSGVTSLKLLGIGLTLAVLVDATLVRGVLVPAFMALAGPANWWAPTPLRFLHARFGLREAAPSPEAAHPHGMPRAGRPVSLPNLQLVPAPDDGPQRASEAA
jgi:putative drug exporter of the RND superfamily